MAQEDERGWEDRLLVIGHNEMVTLELPHHVGNRLDLHIYIAGKQEWEE